MASVFKGLVGVGLGILATCSMATSVLAATETAKNKAAILSDDDEAIQARIDLIRSAKKEILVSYFIIHDDDAMRVGLASLFEAAQRGVQVKVMIDSLSNQMPEEFMVAAIQKTPNIQFRLFHQFRFDKMNYEDILTRLHDKALIVDGADGETDASWVITGGRNVSTKYFGRSTDTRQFRDIDMVATGSVAKEAAAYFTSLWNNEGEVIDPSKDMKRYVDLDRKCPTSGFSTDPICTDKENRAILLQKRAQAVAELKAVQKALKEGKNFPVKLAKNGEKFAGQWPKNLVEVKEAHFLFDPPNKHKNNVNVDTEGILGALVRFINENAKRSLDMLNPYVVLTPYSLKFLSDLRDRNVHLTINTNSVCSSDNVLAQGGYQYGKESLLGVLDNLYEFKGPATTHAKVAAMDNHITLVGTFNFDPRSASLNREIGIIVVEDEIDGGRTPSPLNKQLLTAMEQYKLESRAMKENGIRNEENLKSVPNCPSKTVDFIKFLWPYLPDFVKSNV